MHFYQKASTRLLIFLKNSVRNQDPLDGIDVLISGGAGQGLIRRLDSMGIQGLVTPETEPDSAVADFLNGTLKLGQPESHVGNCEHHDGKHACCH